MVTSKECKEQEWSKQYTPGNPFQRGQQEDQRYAGRMMLKKIYRSCKCQIGRPLSRIEEDGRKWLRRPNLCTKSCRAVLRRRRLLKDMYFGTHDRRQQTYNIFYIYYFNHKSSLEQIRRKFYEKKDDYTSVSSIVPYV